MDEDKVEALMQWINCLNVGPHLTSLKQLCSGHHFIGIIRLMQLSFNKSKLILENWPRTVHQFLEDYYALHISTAVDLYAAADAQNELEIAKVAVLILCASINNEGQEHFLLPLTKLSEDTQRIIKDIIEGVLSGDALSLNLNFSSILLRTGDINNSDVTSIEVSKPPPKIYVYDSNSCSPINEFLHSPYILQKMAVREKELLIRKLKNDLSAEMDSRMELEQEVKSHKEIICSQEHDISRLKSKITELRIQTNDLVNYKALLNDREEELKKLVIRCQKLEGGLADYSSIMASNVCLAKEKIDLEEQLEKLDKAYKSCNLNLKVKSDLEAKLEMLQLTLAEKDELIASLNGSLKDKDCLLKEMQDIQTEQDTIRNLESMTVSQTSAVGESMSVVTEILQLEELLKEKEKRCEALDCELMHVKSKTSGQIKVLCEDHYLEKTRLLNELEKRQVIYDKLHEASEELRSLKKDHTLVKNKVFEYKQQCQCLVENEAKQWNACTEELLVKRAENERLFKELKAKEEFILKLKLEQSDMISAHDGLCSEKETLNAELNASKEKIKQLESDALLQEDVLENTQKEICKCEITIQHLKKEAKDLQDGYIAVEMKHADQQLLLEGQLTDLSEQLKQVEKCITDKESFIGQLKDEIKDLVCKNENCKQEYEVLFKELKAKEQHIKDMENWEHEMKSTHDRLIKEIETIGTNWIRTKEKVKQLESDAQIREDILATNKLDIVLYEENVKRLEAEAKDQQEGYIRTEAQHAEHEAAMEAQLEDLTKQHRELEKVTDEKKHITEQLQITIKDLICQNESCKQECISIQELLKDREEYIQTLKTQKCHMQSEHESHEKENKSLNAELIVCHCKIGQLEEDVKIWKDSLAKTHQEVNHYEETLQRLESKVKDKEESYKSAKAQCDAQMNQLKELTDRLLYVEKTVNEKDNIIEQLQADIKVLGCKNENCMQKYERLLEVLKAKEEYIEQLKNKECDLLSRHDGLAKEADVLRAKLIMSQETIQQFESDTHTKEDVLAKARLDINHYEETIQQLEREICEMQREFERLTKEVETMNNELIISQVKTRDLEVAIQTQEGALVKAQQEIGHYEETIKRLQSEAKENEDTHISEIAQHVEQRNALVKQIEEQSERLQQAKIAMNENASVIEKLQVEIKNLNCKNERCKQEYEMLLQGLKEEHIGKLEKVEQDMLSYQDRLAKKNETLSTELNRNHEKIRQLESDGLIREEVLANIQLNVHHYKEAVKQMECETKDMQENYKRLEAQHTEKQTVLEVQLENLTKEHDELKKVINEKELAVGELQDKFKDMVCRNESCNNEYERLLEAFRVKEEHNATLDAHNSEMKSKYERLSKETELVNTKLIANQTITRELEVDVQIHKDAMTKAQYELSHHEEIFKRLESEAKEKEDIHKNAIMYHVEQKNALVSQVDELNEKLCQVEKNIKEKETVVEKLENEIKHLICKNENCKQDYEMLLEVAKAKEDHIKKLENKECDMQSNHVRLAKETEMLSAELIVSQEKIKQLESDAQTMVEVLANARLDIHCYEETIKRMERETNDMHESYKGAEQQHTKRQNALECQLEDLEKECKENKNLLNEKKGIILQLQEKIQNLVCKNEICQQDYENRFQTMKIEQQEKEVELGGIDDFLFTIHKETSALILRIGELNQRFSQVHGRDILEISTNAKRIQNLESSVMEMQTKMALPNSNNTTMKGTVPCQKTKKSIDTHIQEIDKNLVHLKHEMEALESTAEKLWCQMSAKDMQLRQRLTETTSLMCELSSQKDMNKKLTETFGTKMNEIQHLEALVADTEKKFTAQKEMYQAQFEMNNQERENLLNKCHALKAQVHELQQKLNFHKEFTEQIENMQRQVANAEKKNSVTVSMMNEKLVSLSEKYEKAKSIISTLTCEKEELSRQIRNLQVQLDFANQKLLHLEFKRRESTSHVPSVTLTCDSLEGIRFNFENGQARDAQNLDNIFSINAGSYDLSTNHNFSAVEGSSALHPMSVLPSKAGSFFPCADEQGEFLNFSYLNDLKNGKCLVVNDAGRIEELQRRNSLCLPHLRSSYPVETQVQPLNKFRDEDVKMINATSEVILPEKLSCTYSLPSDINDQTVNDALGTKPRIKGIQPTYRKPGPPTPGKAKSPPVSQLKPKSKTPASFKKFLRPSKFITPKSFRLKGSTTKRKNQENHPPEAAVPLARRNISFTVGFSPKAKLQVKSYKAMPQQTSTPRNGQ